jgi:hypothetical protein
MAGISFRQGGHQVAQKFTSTTLPAQASKRVSAPELSRKAVSTSGLGASWKTIRAMSPAAEACSRAAASGERARAGLARRRAAAYRLAERIE